MENVVSQCTSILLHRKLDYHYEERSIMFHGIHKYYVSETFLIILRNPIEF